MTVEALKEIEGITSREADRSKNFFALGLMSWLYHRPGRGDARLHRDEFGRPPEIAEANTKAFKAGWNYGETSEDFAVSYEIAPAKLDAGHLPADLGQLGAHVRPRRGEQALRAPAVPGRVPDHAGLDDPRGAGTAKHFGVRTFQAEDEIAASGRHSARRSAVRSG